MVTECRRCSVRLDFQVYVEGLRLWLEAVMRFARDLAEVERSAPAHTGEVEQIADEPLEAKRLAADRVGGLPG